MLFVRLKFIDLCDNRLTGFPNPASWKSTLLKEVMVSRNSIPKVSTPLNWWLLVTQVKLSGGKFRWNSFCMNFTDSDYFSCDFHVIHLDMKFPWKNTCDIHVENNILFKSSCNIHKKILTWTFTTCLHKIWINFICEECAVLFKKWFLVTLV